MKRLIIGMMMIALLSGIAFAMPSSDNLMYYYEMEVCSGQQPDSAGVYNRNLTINDAFTNSTGIVGQSCYTNGDDVDKYMNNNAMQNMSNLRSVDYWIYIEPLGTVNQWQVSFNNETVWGKQQINYVFIRITEQIQNYNYQNSADIDLAANVGNLSYGDWYHIVYVFNGTNHLVFVNGVQTYNFASNVLWDDTMSRFWIGRRADGLNSNERFKGFIDNVAIWDYAFTPDDVVWAYNSGSGQNYSAIGLSLDFDFEPKTNITSNIIPHTELFYFDVTENASCTLYQNNSVMNESYVESGLNNLSITYAAQVNRTIFNYTMECNSTEDNHINESKLINVLIDETFPEIFIYNPTQNSKQIDNISLNVSFQDDNLYNASVAIFALNNSLMYYNSTTGLVTDRFDFLENINISAYPKATYTFVAEGCDGHTKTAIRDYDVLKPSVSKLTFNDEVSISYLSDTNTITKLDAEKAVDRYHIVVETSAKTAQKGDLNARYTHSFIVTDELGSGVTYLPHSFYKAHFVIGNYWIDHEVEGETDETWTVTQISKTQYRVDIETSKTKMILKSIGELNCNNASVTFRVPELAIAFFNNTPANGSLLASNSTPLNISLPVNITNFVNDLVTCDLYASYISPTIPAQTITNQNASSNPVFNFALQYTSLIDRTLVTYNVSCRDSVMPDFNTSESKQVFLLVDDTAPVLTVERPYPNNSSLISDDFLIVSLSSFDRNNKEITINVTNPLGDNVLSVYLNTTSSLNYTLDITYNSTGTGLNVIQGNYTMNVVAEDYTGKKASQSIMYLFDDRDVIYHNDTEIFERKLAEGQENNMYIHFCFNTLLLDSLNVSYLELNNTNYTVDPRFIYATPVRLNYNLSAEHVAPFVPADTDFDHIWHVGMNPIGGGPIQWFSSDSGVNTTQTIYDVKVRDELEATTEDIPLLNISVYDEITGNPINLTVGTNLNFLLRNMSLYNNDTNYTTSKVYNSAGYHNIIFNTTVDSDDLNLTWSLSGDILISGSFDNVSYTTRTITIPESMPIIINNSEPYQLDIYGIGLENSTTVTYNWKTTDYVDIAGTMRVYRCQLDGTRLLVESVPITGGLATANIELLTAQYSYDVIIDGIVYQQESFYACHVEALTSRDFFVDITTVDLAPAIGLFMIDCTMEKSGNNTVTMRWTANSEDPSPITGCIVATSQNINGSNAFYRNCTDAGFTLTRTIPNPGVSYNVKGYLTQSGIEGFCRQDVIFSDERNVALLFGATLLFGLMFLVIGLALIYAGRSTESLIGAGAAVVVAFVLGLIALPWTWVMSVLSLLIVVALVARYGRGDN